MKDKREARYRRHRRIRKKIFGTPERPRLNIFKSLKHIYGQIIDDLSGRTLVSAATVEKGLKEELNGKCDNIEAARKTGALIAKRALQKGIKKVVFDRGGYPYHGKVKAFADAAREAGLEF